MTARRLTPPGPGAVAVVEISGASAASSLAELGLVELPRVGEIQLVRPRAGGELLDEARKSHALELLADPQLSIEQIAFVLGYSDDRGFRRAFTRWVGSSPAAHRRGLRVIDSMTNPHHLVLRTREPQPRWNVGPLGPIRAPGLRVLPLLMSAAGEAATEWVLTKADSAVANATIGFASGRAATIEAQWSDTAARTELEVADQHGVTVITVDPLPRLEIDGHPVDVPAVEPIEALGFVAQIERLAQVAAGRVAPWPDLSVGSALWTLVDG